MNKIITCILLLVGFTNSFAQQLNINLGQLKSNTRDGNLEIDFQLDLSTKKIRNGNSLFIHPVIAGEQDTLHLPILILHSKDAFHAHIRSGKEAKDFNAFSIQRFRKNEPWVNYSTAVKQESWMNTAKLHVYAMDCFCGSPQKEHLAQSRPLKGIEHLPQKQTSTDSLWVSPMDVELLNRELHLANKHSTANIYFVQGKHTITHSYAANEVQLEQLKKKLSEVLQNKLIRIQKIELTGYSSVEGTYAFNQKLSLKRANALKNWIINQSPQLTDTLFEVEGAGEDWDGLAKLVSTSSYPWKEEVLQIFSTHSIHKGREAELMKFSKGVPYQQMYSTFFPELRKVKYRIQYSTVSNPEVQLEFQGNLHWNAMQQIGSETDLVSLLEDGYFEEALFILNTIPESADKWNNIGVVYTLQDKLGDAISMYLKAIDLGSENAKHNIKSILKQVDEKLNNYNPQPKGVKIQIN